MNVAKGEKRRTGEPGVVCEGRELCAASPWPREQSTLCLLYKSRFSVPQGWPGRLDMCHTR